MIPFFFGDADRPLFGIHHQPSSSQFQDTSIILCNPIGFEYGRSHSILMYLAKRLSANGYHVLRFDYFATGDSSGHSNEVSIKQCLKDIESSCEEIKAVSATRKVTVIGYRIGAAFAAYASINCSFKRLVLWDPVIDGKDYLDKLQAMHKQMLHDTDRFDTRYMPSTEPTNELVGYEYPDELRSEICAIDLSKIEKVKSRKIDIFCYQDSECAGSIIQDDNFLANAAIHQFDNRAEWDDVEKIESKFLVDPLIEKILEVVG